MLAQQGRTDIFVQNCLVLLAWQQLCLSLRLPMTALSVDTETLVQSQPRVLREHTDTVWCMSCDLDHEEAPLEESWRAVDRSLDSGTHSHRETSLSISTLVQTSLSEITVLSFYYSHLSHVLFPLFYQAIEAPPALQRRPWHVPCRRTMAKTGIGLGLRRGICTDALWSSQVINRGATPRSEYAIALAAETGAELSILMVLSPPLIAGMSDAMACTLVVESIMAQSATVLADVVAIAEQAGIAYTTHVRWGNTADAVLRTTEEEDCDLIIVGSHACTWRGHRLLRHVIKKLTTSARQPLLVVTAPPEETYRGTSWARLLVVHDGSPEGEAAVGYARALAHRSGARCLPAPRA